MADYVFTMTIPEAKTQRVVDAMKGIYPVPINVETGEPLFNDAQWAKECVINFIKRTVYRYESSVAVNTAKEGVEEDADIVN